MTASNLPAGPARRAAAPAASAQGDTVLELCALDLMQSLDHTLHLAPQLEELGYRRYWIAEHPPQPSPVLVSALVAGTTERMRVGPAGILLYSSSPARAAYDFQLLEWAFPGRIDAGFCPGWFPPSLVGDYLDGRDSEIERAPQRFPDKAARLVRYLRPKAGADEPIQSWPQAPTSPPEIWCLGGSPRSARIAAAQGVGFGYSLFHQSSRDDTSAVDQYRSRFSPSVELPSPRVVLAVAGVCAETDGEARRQADAWDNEWIVATIVGAPERCQRALVALARRFDCQEFAFLDLCATYEDRLTCYRLLAQAAGLGAGDETEAAGPQSAG